MLSTFVGVSRWWHNFSLCNLEAEKGRNYSQSKEEPLKKKKQETNVANSEKA